MGCRFSESGENDKKEDWNMECPNVTIVRQIQKSQAGNGENKLTCPGSE